MAGRPGFSRRTHVTGKRVRLIGDPGSVGLLDPERTSRGGIVHCKVLFTTGWRWTPEDPLEVNHDEQESPLDLFRRSRLGGAMVLRRTLIHVRLRGKRADMVYGMEGTNTDFYAYPFKPALKRLMCPAKGYWSPTGWASGRRSKRD